MAYSTFTARGLLLVVLGCVGCDAVGNEDDTDPSQQGVSGEDGGAFLVPVPIGDAGIGSGLTTKIPSKTDGGVSEQGDAGQSADAGEEPQGDAGQEPIHVVTVDPTSGLPDCNAVYFRDLDNDGFGDSAFKVTSCTQPAGYVTVDGDCYDSNERAHPGATGQFLQERGDGSFDYDCDGVETKLHTQLAVCPQLDGCTALGCDASALEAASEAAANGGWTLGAVPACGQEGVWGLDVSWYPGLAKPLCTPPVEGTTRVQTCR